MAAPGSRVQRLGIEGVKHIVAVSSCKGGVGKSTTAVNLTLALKNLGKSAGILDADLQGPSIHRMLNMHLLTDVMQTPSGKLLPPQNYGVKAMSLGLLLGDDKAVVARGPMVSQQLVQLIQTVEWGDMDILIIDCPPGTNDVHITLTQQVCLDGAIIVTTPQDIATMDTRRGMMMFRQVSIPMLGVVENMSHFICDGCGKSHNIFGDTGGSREAAAAFGVPFLGTLPLDTRLRAGGDAGEPVTHMGEQGHPLAAPYYAIARELISVLESEENPGRLRITIEDDELDEDLQPGTGASQA
eukprot:TRINITY_DN32688_c0_g1_i1.p1 TRINITY_DN32688_c0_g1~~TRINITY_DN32688_c0_g1_i1.p1  ORF type:complete len:318 (+),score=90.59 TRINITY_DN32688_c0_g1_i1:61-954(+)